MAHISLRNNGFQIVDIYIGQFLFDPLKTSRIGKTFDVFRQ